MCNQLSLLKRWLSMYMHGRLAFHSRESNGSNSSLSLPSASSSHFWKWLVNIFKRVAMKSQRERPTCRDHLSPRRFPFEIEIGVVVLVHQFSLQLCLSNPNTVCIDRYRLLGDNPTFTYSLENQLKTLYGFPGACFLEVGPWYCITYPLDKVTRTTPHFGPHDSGLKTRAYMTANIVKALILIIRIKRSAVKHHGEQTDR